MLTLLIACALIAAAVGIVTAAAVPSVSLFDDLGGVRSMLRRSGENSPSGAPTNLHEAMLARSRSERVVNPALKRIQSIARRLTPVGRIDALYRKAVAAGVQSTWTRQKLVTAKAIGAIVGVAVGVAAWEATGGGPAGFMIAGSAATIGYMGLDLMLNGRAKARQSAILNQLPDVIDQISISVQAGLGFEAAIARTADSVDNALTDELKRMMNDIRLGSSRANAFAAMSERVGVDDLSNFVRSIAQAEKTGVSISKVLEVQADEQRERRRQRAEERAMRMPVFLIFPLVLCILPPLFIVLLGPAVIQLMDNGFG